MATHFKIQSESGTVLVNLDRVCVAEWRDGHLTLAFAPASASDTPPKALRVEGDAAAAIWRALESGAAESEGSARWERH